jgi:tetratricopeptide (TPR) repeat protein
VYPGILLISLLLGEPPQPSPPTEDAQVPSGLSNFDLAERAAEEFQAGVQLRQNVEKARPHFRTAAAYFEELRRRGARNAILYRNLGNAYLLSDDLPRAILSYRRGLRLAPADRSLLDNLEQARDRVVYLSYSNLGRQLPQNRPPWLPRLASEWVFVAAVLVYGVGWVCLTRWFMIRRGRLMAAGLAALVIASLLIAWVFEANRGARRDEEQPLVMIAEDGVLLRKGDNLTFPPRYETPVNRGVEARLLHERGAWLQIELAGGEVGWISRGYALVDKE